MKAILAPVVLLWLVSVVPAGAAAQPDNYVGRPVEDVLRELESADLRIIFSSDVVPPALRVKTEPKTRKPREIAEQILTPHGLMLRKAPRGTWVVVARPALPERLTIPRPTPRSSAQASTAEQRAPQPLRFEERVDVTDRLRETGSAATAYTIEPADARELAGGFENVFQMLQVFPGAAGINDDEGKLAVRGAGPEHNLIVIDGLQIHRPQRLGHFTASFLNPATLARVSLDASGLDARYGQRLSSVTVIDTRDGALDRTLATSGSLGLTAGDILFEGKLPKTETGSWWLTTRGTYYRAVFDPFADSVTPGFNDVQFKVSVRPTGRTRLTLFGLGGRETLRSFERLRLDGPEIVADEYRGDNRVGVLNLSWTPGNRLVTTTSLSAYAHDERDYEGFSSIGVDPFERTTRVHDFAARQQAVYAVSPVHLLEAGVEVRRVRSAWRMASVKQPEFWRGLGPSTWGEGIDYATGPIGTTLTRTQAAFWLQDRISLGPRWKIEPGVRLDWNSFTGESSWQPRVRLSGRLGRTLFWTGAAVQAQTPSHESLQGLDYFHLTEDNGRTLRNERSRQVVLGFERRLRADVALRVEAYHRTFDRLLVQRLETDADRSLRLTGYEIPPDLPPDSVLLEHRPTVHPDSTGRGSARGLEVLVQREGSRLSGWLGYTLSKSTRELYGHEVPFDFDRRHALSASGLVQLSPRVRLAATWQLASGFPVTPLHEEVWFAQRVNIDGTVDPIRRPSRNPDGTLFMNPWPFMRRFALRNSDRLSGYGRTDVRVTFATLGHWEFYGEVINLFKQRNYLLEMTFPPVNGIPGSVSRSNIYTELERIPTAGLRFRF